MEPPSSAVVVNTRTLSAGLTGVQRYTAELCDELGPLVRAVAPYHVAQGMTGHLWEQLVLPRLVGQNLLWSPGNSGPLWTGRQVVTVHDLAVLDYPQWFNPRLAAWYRWLLPRLVRRARCIIAVSEFSKRRLVATTGLDESRVAVVPNGVAARFRPPPPGEVESMRRRLGLPSSTYFLSLGSREPRKNLIRLLEAWRLCESSLPDEVWLVVAGAPGLAHVFGEVRATNIPRRVHLTGFVADHELPALYGGALAMIYVSVYEGFGLPVLEAMATGTPPIASDCTAVPEIVGDAGLLVDPLDVHAMASAIVGLMEDSSLRERLAHRSLERSSQFTWQQAARSTWRILSEAAAA